MQSKSVHFMILGLVLCLIGIAPSMADTTFQGIVYQWTNWNTAGVQNGPPVSDTVFTVDEPITVTYLDSYHWNDGQGVDYPGSISLIGEDGTEYGPFDMKGKNGQGGVPNAWWYLNLDAGEVVLQPGTYMVVDSDPYTWASNSRSDDAGFFAIKWEENGPVPPISTGKGSDCSWKGSWKGAPSNFGEPVVLTQSGNSVTGKYPLNDGKIKGTVSGNILSGTWYEGSRSGRLEFTMQSDCKISGRVSSSSGGEMSYKFGLTRS